MFEIADITSREGRWISHFSYRQVCGTTQVLLSQNADFLDGLQGVLTGKEALAGGCIVLDGKRFRPQRAAFVTQTCRMYPEQTVIANVFTDMSFRQLGSRCGQALYEKLTREAGFFVEPYRVVSQLTITEQKMVEMLCVFYQKPELLVIRGLSNFVSVETFQKMLQLVERLNAEGTTVLYLTNRLEEAILLPYGITVIDNGRIQGTYAPQEITADPRSIFFISIGAQKPELGGTLRAGGAERDTDTWENIRMFARYLVREMSAAATAVFLLDTVQHKLLAKAVSTEREGEYAACLRERTLFELLGRTNITEFGSKLDAEHFEQGAPCAAVLGYPVKISGDLSLVVQINYRNAHRCTPRDAMILKWVAQEMGISIENTWLAGNAVLLRESHHRIKNNLQVVVNLLELEKELLPQQVAVPAAQTGIEQAFDSAIQRIKCIAGIHDLLTIRKFSSNCGIDKLIGKVCEFYTGCAQFSLTASAVRIPYAKAVSTALVINELVSNSIKHNCRRAEPLEITITVVQDEATGELILYYRDNGCGFPPARAADEAHTGAGRWIITSVVVYEFRGTIEERNENGAVVEIHIPRRALLPLEKRQVASDIYRQN